VGEPRYPYVHVDVRAAEVEEISAALWELGAQGIEERDHTTLDRPVAPSGDVVTLVASFADDAGAAEAVAAIGREARVTHVVGDAWRDAWREHFKPTRVGERLVVRPSWEPFEAQAQDVVLTIDPDRAFGTGTHETTRLVMRELDRRVRGGEQVLDVGCGSGILAVAALLLGAQRARAIDVDEDAVRVARENAARNGVSARMRADATPVERVRGVYPIVVANIEAKVLVPLAKAIARRVAPGGVLVLSGILRGQEDEVRAAYPGFSLDSQPNDGEWVALVLLKEGKP
jgi:ribosomal protein L11 methyltransferase